MDVHTVITLGQFMKLAGLAATGGEAKYLIASGRVLVNGALETRRGRRLASGDVVETDAGAAEVVPPKSMRPVPVPEPGPTVPPEETDQPAPAEG